MPSLRKKPEEMHNSCTFSSGCVTRTAYFPGPTNAHNSHQIVSSVVFSLVDRIFGDSREQKGELVLPLL